MPESAYHYKSEDKIYNDTLWMLDAITGLTQDDLRPAEASFLKNEIKRLVTEKPVPEHRYSEEAVAGFLANYYGIEDMNILLKIGGGTDNVRHYLLSQRNKRELL